MEKRTAVLVVDDEAKIREIVGSYLERSGYEALPAGSAAEALRTLGERPVSLILLDLMLPDLPGEELCRRVRELSAVPIIMMTAKSDEESIVRGLELGADDYVSKPFSPRELMARVAAALRRGEGRTSGAEPLVGETAGSIRIEGRTVRLTPSEYRILWLLKSSPERTFSREDIIEAVKPDDYDGFDRTIDSHIKNLRRKIEADPKTPHYVLTVHGFGYRWGGNP